MKGIFKVRVLLFILYSCFLGSILGFCLAVLIWFFYFAASRHTGTIVTVIHYALFTGAPIGALIGIIEGKKEAKPMIAAIALNKKRAILSGLFTFVVATIGFESLFIDPTEEALPLLGYLIIALVFTPMGVIAGAHVGPRPRTR